MAANGMLSGLFGPGFKDQRQEALDEDARLRSLATIGPFAADAYTAYSSAKQAGQGLGQAVGGALGADTRTPTEKNLAAIQKAKDEVSKLGFNPDDPKSVDQFYTQVIQILQRQGLVAEAADVAREWHTQKLGDQKADLQNRDLARKEAADKALIEYRNKNLDVLKQKGIPEFQKYLDEVEKTSDPFTRKMLTDRLNQMLGKAGKGVIVKDAGDHLAIVDAATGDILGSEDVGAKPMSGKDQAKQEAGQNQMQTAFDHAIAALQESYNAAVQLYNHPGLKEITGPIAGLAAKGDPNAPGFTGTALRMKFSEAGRSALAEFQKVQGTVFIAALQDLKSQSKTGASGLGQLTEVEGAKIQNAKAALDPQQDYASFRMHLKQYIDQITNSVALLRSEAERSKLTGGNFTPKDTLAKPGRYVSPPGQSATPAPPSAPASAAPSAAPAPAPAAGGTEGWSIRRKP